MYEGLIYARYSGKWNIPLWQQSVVYHLEQTGFSMPKLRCPEETILNVYSSIPREVDAVIHKNQNHSYFHL